MARHCQPRRASSRMAQSGAELEIRITQGCPCAGMTDLEPGHVDLTWTAYIGAGLDTSGIWKLIECGEFMQTQSTERRHSSGRVISVRIYSE